MRRVLKETGVDIIPPFYTAVGIEYQIEYIAEENLKNAS